MGGDERVGFDLRKQLGVLRRRKVIILAFVAAVLVITVIVSLLQTTTYRARSLVLVASDPNASLLVSNLGIGQGRPLSVDTEVEVVKGQSVRDAVSKKLGTVPKVSVARLAGTDIIEVAAENGDAATAADIVNTWVTAYIDLHEADVEAQVTAAKARLRGQTADLQAQLAALPNGDERRNVVLGQLTALGQRLDDLELAAPLLNGDVRVIRPASKSDAVSSAGLARNVAVAVPFGLVFGVLFAFLLEYLKGVVETSDDVHAVVAPIQVIASVPNFGRKRTDQDSLVTVADPTSPAAEAFHGLRASLDLFGMSSALRTILVTSPSGAEGKTTTAANLSVAWARAGHLVVAVNCDLRRPRLHAVFGLADHPGLTTVLRDGGSLPDTLQQVSGERVAVLPGGPIGSQQSNPSQLLSSDRFRAVIETLLTKADIVVLDAPPLLPVADVIALSSVADAIVLVVAAGVTKTRDLERAIERVSQLNPPVAGVVLNRATTEDSYSYSYSSAESPSTEQT